MWVDEDDVVHTISVPPEVVLGEESAASLRSVANHVAVATVEELDERFDDIVEITRAEAPPGPTDIVDVDLDSLPYPPTFIGPVPHPGEELTTTILRFLDEVPPQWRLDAFEAVCEALERDDATAEL